MAIKNLIKTDTYSRIGSIQYHSGQVNNVEVICYKDTPTESFKSLRTLKKITVTDVNGDEAEAEVYPTETADIIHVFTFTGSDLSTLEINASENIHSQVYTHLMTLLLFDGCVSDE